MNNRKLYVFIVILLLFSCRRNEVVIDSVEKEIFITSQKLGYYKDGHEVLSYDRGKHQIAVNNKRHSFRLQSDGQQEYLNVKLEAAPRSPGIHIVIYYNIFSTQENVSYTHLFECSKMSNDKIWFWNADTKEGIITPILK